MDIKRIKEELDVLKQCPSKLRSSDNFQYSVTVDYIKKGSCCDSSDGRDVPANFVRQEIIDMVDKNKMQILESAAKMAEKDFEEFRKL